MSSEMGRMVANVAVHTWRQRQNNVVSLLLMEPIFINIEAVAKGEQSMKQNVGSCMTRSRFGVSHPDDTALEQLLKWIVNYERDTNNILSLSM